MSLTSVDDITKVVFFAEYEIFLVNDSIVVEKSTEIESQNMVALIEQYKDEQGLEEFDTDFSGDDLAAIQPLLEKRQKINFLYKARVEGKKILDEVGLLLLDKDPTPSEGLANLAALETVDKLLNRGDLRVAKAALEAADLTGTSFDGDSDSYDYIIGLLDQKIAELTP